MQQITNKNTARLYVLVKLEPGVIEEFVSKSSRMKGVVRSSPVTGTFDVIVTVEEESTAKGLRVVLKDLCTLEGVLDTQTLVEVPLQ